MIALASRAASPQTISLDRFLSTAQADLAACLDYVYHPSFSLPATENRLFGPEAPVVTIPAWTDFFAIGEEGILHTGRSATLKTGEEKILFLRYNYARFRLAKLMRARTPKLDLQELWQRRARQTRADLTQANLPLVLAMAKRMRLPNLEIEELIAEGNMALLRCVDRFDISMGFKFSTYACRAILKSFHRLSAKWLSHRQRFPVSYLPELEQPDIEEPRQQEDWDDSVEYVKRILSENRAALSPMEQMIVAERFSLAQREKGKTLSEIGKIAGLSIERVRQILNQAMNKIRCTLDREILAA